ncbi:Tub-like protein [Ordospora colligata]|nr:Tub-like protein [Ordospora colligata]
MDEGKYNSTCLCAVMEGNTEVTPPPVYEFSYSPELDLLMDHLDEVAFECDGKDLLALASNKIQQERRNAVFNPYPVGKVSRGKLDVNYGFLNEYLYESQDYAPHKLLKARRTICGFEIYSLDQDAEEYVGCLRSNILGTKYSLEQNDQKVVEIRYLTSVFKRRGPREFSVLFMGMAESTGKPIVMRNKEPYYNVETNSYSLNFNGRVTTPSVKNFQLVHPLDPTYVTLTFGKVSRYKYILDYAYPWTGVQAFAIALTALDYKIGCD